MTRIRGVYYFVVVICESYNRRLDLCGAPDRLSPSPVQCIDDRWIQLSGSQQSIIVSILILSNLQRLWPSRYSRVILRR